MYACYVYNAIITYIKSVGVLISKMFLSTVKKIMQRIFLLSCIYIIMNYQIVVCFLTSVGSLENTLPVTLMRVLAAVASTNQYECLYVVYGRSS